MRLTRINRFLGAALGAALLLLGFAGTASADRLVDYHFNHVDGATVAAQLWQRTGGDQGLYVNVKMRNTRRLPGCVNAAVRWVSPRRNVEDQASSSPRHTRPFETCVRKRWIDLHRTPVRRVADFERVQTHVAVVGGKGQWKDLIGWNRRDVKRKADRIMQMSYRTFLKYKDAAIRNRHHGGAREDNTWPLDWSDDGCTIPGQESIDIARAVSAFFNAACQQHDFGYRNYGKHYLALNRTDDARKRIDDKLEVELTRACGVAFRGGNGLRNCKNTANIIWGAVRFGGSDAFFGLE